MDILVSVGCYLSTKKKFQSQLSGSSLDQKFVLENIVDSKSSLRLISSIIVILASLAAFLGYKGIDEIKQTVSENVSKQVRAAAQVDLEYLRQNRETIANIINESRKLDISSLRQRASYIATLQDDTKRIHDNASHAGEAIDKIYNRVRWSQQSLFVVESLYVQQGTTRKTFSELNPVGGMTIPKLKDPPVILASAYRDNVGIGMDVRQTREYVELSPGENAYINLWIFVK
jgi:hypothetical protein